MMVDDFNDVGLVDRSDCLTGLVVIHQDQLQSRRIKRVAVAANADVLPCFVDHPKLIALLAHDPVQGIADTCALLELGHGRIACFLSRYVHQFANSDFLASRMRANRPAQEVKKADDGHQAERLPTGIQDGRHATSSVGDGPDISQRMFRRGRVERWQMAEKRGDASVRITGGSMPR